MAHAGLPSVAHQRMEPLNCTHNRPRANSKRVAWLWVVLCVLAILSVVPVARVIQAIISEQLGGALAFLVIVVCAGLYFLYHVVCIVHATGGGLVRYGVLVFVTGVFFVYLYSLRRNPEEALHVVEYGVLALLLIRALRYSVMDSSIYASTFFLVVSVGIIDEAVQWVVPDRFWGLEDIGINATAALFVIAAVGLGIRPSGTCTRPQWRGVKLSSQLGVFTVLACFLTVLNTPDRILSYASRVPALQFLITNNSVMWEYGFKYHDEEIGVFRSRFDVRALAGEDHGRAFEAAKILDEYSERSDYREFLKRYTPVTDPFVHELRVHLFRRDVYFAQSVEDKYSDEERLYAKYVAYYENKIVEKYYPQTLVQSVLHWPAERVQNLANTIEYDAQYESPVSRHLFTLGGEGSVLTTLGILLLILLVLGAIAHVKLQKELEISR